MPKAAKKEAPAKKEKAKKDPNAPKKPMHAYMWFCKDKRDAVKSDMPPESGITDISKKLGEMWKTLSDKDKEKYNAQASQDKERYEKEMAKYNKAKA